MWAAAVAVIVVIFKFILKPLFKVLALVALAVAVWWFLGDDISSWLSLTN